MVPDLHSTVTIHEALERFLLQLDADGRSVHTRLQYRRHVRLLVRWLEKEHGAAHLGVLNPEVVARFMVSLDARNRPDGAPKKPTAVNALRTSIRCFCVYLRDAGLVQSNPAMLLRRAICSSRRSRALDENEVERLMVVLQEGQDPPGQRDRVLFTLMLATGIRIGSALGLDVEDVDLERGELLLRRTKGSREDRVFLPHMVVPTLAVLVAEVGTGPVFRNGGGERLTPRHANRRLAQLFERAGIRRVNGSHALRHTFATRLYGRTGDVLLVREALCHRSVASTLVYARPDDTRLRSVLR
jgi:site-specific recombinase XerD